MRLAELDSHYQELVQCDEVDTVHTDAGEVVPLVVTAAAASHDALGVSRLRRVVNTDVTSGRAR